MIRHNIVIFYILISKNFRITIVSSYISYFDRTFDMMKSMHDLTPLLQKVGLLLWYVSEFSIIDWSLIFFNCIFLQKPDLFLSWRLSIFSSVKIIISLPSLFAFEIWLVKSLYLSIWLWIVFENSTFSSFGRLHCL